MRVEFVSQETSVRASLNKLTFRVSNIEEIENFLLYFVREVQLLEVFNITSQTRIGFEVFSNVKFGVPPLYIPLRKLELLRNEHLFLRLRKILVSNVHFLNLDESFEIVVAVVNI